MRKKISKATETAVLLKSRRRCCFCAMWDNDYAQKDGQFAHIDRIHSHSDESNLAYLCLPHHDKYDGSGKQTKRWTPEELRHARDSLYESLGTTGNVCRVVVTVTIDADHSKFTPELQGELIGKFGSVLLSMGKGQIDEFRVLRSRPGSVVLDIEMSFEDAAALAEAFDHDLLSSLAVVDLVVQSVSDSASADQFPLLESRIQKSRQYKRVRHVMATQDRETVGINQAMTGLLTLLASRAKQSIQENRALGTSIPDLVTLSPDVRRVKKWTEDRLKKLREAVDLHREIVIFYKDPSLARPSDFDRKLARLLLLFAEGGLFDEVE